MIKVYPFRRIHVFQNKNFPSFPWWIGENELYASMPSAASFFPFLFFIPFPPPLIRITLPSFSFFFFEGGGLFQLERVFTKNAEMLVYITTFKKLVNTILHTNLSTSPAWFAGTLVIYYNIQFILWETPTRLIVVWCASSPFWTRRETSPSLYNMYHRSPWPEPIARTWFPNSRSIHPRRESIPEESARTQDRCHRRLLTRKNRMMEL